MTIKQILKRPEILAPAGTLEKLKTAINYGADAVYIGGNAYSLRSRAGNFSYEEMTEGVRFANNHNAKVYVAANMITHEANQAGAGDFFRKIRDIGVAAVIISDPALVEICITEAPGLAVHLSTQASAANYETLEFWRNEGLERVVLAREISMKEVAEIRQHTSVELEAFIHGAMCISYSGRCTLSNHMSMRDANRGGCSQSCRWKYDLFDLPFGTERNYFTESKKSEKFSMSAVDLSMIEHLPDLIQNGVDSLKIEGRMKSIHYVSTVANVYKRAVDSYMADPEHYSCQQEWIDELWKVAQRELSTGFYYHIPTETEQLFGPRRKIPQYKFIGEVISYDKDTQIATIRQRNVFNLGDRIEFYGPGMRHFTQQVSEMHNEQGESIVRAPHPMMILTMPVKQAVQVGDMIRKQK
ncbi:collagenase-like protease [Tetragenococcus halophilus]|uniref:Collagenase-like protease n=1 Tax=Tetragenococcus halophilus TaxID=51669 RepID=A0A3G5FGL8_TETHA|nr:U32 family peptidase [Tetragenococcus halophilus]AYW49375.1 collagenase-like protease [Tetragenococcus halophilus]GBD62667.1 peptidase U32 family protein [Tetragenococcus halophilus subsp. flandriensis]